MPNFIDILSNQSEKYDLLVSKEDYKNNLIKKILEISNVDKNSTVVDMGAGTGRVSFLLSGHVKKIFAFEKIEGMINTAIRKKNSLKVTNIEFGLADNTKIPLPDNTADLVIEGWAFLAMRLFSEEDPVDLMKKAAKEMERLTKENGFSVIIETQGSCVDNPSPRYTDLPVLKLLADELGYKKEIIETDYKFDSIEQALDLVEFFFDKEGREWVEKNNTNIVKEYSGIWWKKK